MVSGRLAQVTTPAGRIRLAESLLPAFPRGGTVSKMDLMHDKLVDNKMPIRRSTLRRLLVVVVALVGVVVPVVVGVSTQAVGALAVRVLSNLLVDLSGAAVSLRRVNAS